MSNKLFEQLSYELKLNDATGPFGNFPNMWELLHVILSVYYNFPMETLVKDFLL